MTESAPSPSPFQSPMRQLPGMPQPGSSMPVGAQAEPTMLTFSNPKTPSAMNLVWIGLTMSVVLNAILVAFILGDQQLKYKVSSDRAALVKPQVVQTVGNSESFMSGSVTKDETPPQVATLIPTDLGSYLTENCQPNPALGAENWYLPTDAFPLTLLPEVHLTGSSRPESFSAPSGVSCSFEFGQQTNGSLFVDSPFSMFRIYDDSSFEPGHDGPPMKGEFGTELASKNGTRYFVNLSVSQGPAALEEYSLHLRGLKAFQTQSGAPFHVLATVKLLPEGDPQIATALSSIASEYREVSFEYQGQTVRGAYANGVFATDYAYDDFSSFAKTAAGLLGSPVESVMSGDYQELIGTSVLVFDDQEDYQKAEQTAVQSIFPDQATLELQPAFQQLSAAMDALEAK